MDKWLRRIWLVNGVMLFILMVVIAVAAAAAVVQTERRERAKAVRLPEHGPLARTQPADGLADVTGPRVLQEITLSLPRPIGKTDYLFVEIGVTDVGDSLRGRTLAMEPAKAVNLLFAKDDGSDAHLLMDRKGYITGIDIPSPRDTTRAFCLYDIAFDDTDKDGRITVGDARRLHISDLDGRNLAPVLAADIECTGYKVDPRGQRIDLVVRPIATEGTGQPFAPQTLMVFDARTRTLREFALDAAVLERSRSLLKSD